MGLAFWDAGVAGGAGGEIGRNAHHKFVAGVSSSAASLEEGMRAIQRAHAATGFRTGVLPERMASGPRKFGEHTGKQTPADRCLFMAGAGRFQDVDVSRFGSRVVHRMTLTRWVQGLA